MQNHVALYIFNPEHDMALANFSPYYKPPHEIIRMREDLCFLPAWYAPEGSYTYIYNKGLVTVLNNQVAQFKRFPQESFLDCIIDAEIVPWGWNPSLVHHLLPCISESLRLDAARLERIRYLSSRQRCIEVLESFSGTDGICGQAYQCDDAHGIKNILNTHPRVVFKSPWSSSGRGLVFVSNPDFNDNIENRLLRIIRSQGCVMAEPVYDKVLDFAMEFYSDGNGEVSFAGYSMFETDSHGNYKHNLLVGDAVIQETLSRYVRLDVLSQVKEKLLVKLGDMIQGDYKGYFGVDMMVCRDGGGYLLHPCVEVNLRMNMGVVSRILFDRYVNVSSMGKFVIEHYTSDGEALSCHKGLSSNHPLSLDGDGKILSGYLPLTPITSHTRYCAYIVCG